MDSDQIEADQQNLDDGQTPDLKLYALPLVLPAIRPFAQELPMFLLRLATEVDYSGPETLFI